MGVSGGEEGARRGPAMMPGGDAAAYEFLRPIVEKVAAQTDDGPCVTYVGPGGASRWFGWLRAAARAWLGWSAALAWGRVCALAARAFIM